MHAKHTACLREESTLNDDVPYIATSVGVTLQQLFGGKRVVAVDSSREEGAWPGFKHGNSGYKMCSDKNSNRLKRALNYLLHLFLCRSILRFLKETEWCLLFYERTG